MILIIHGNRSCNLMCYDSWRCPCDQNNGPCIEIICVLSHLILVSDYLTILCFLGSCCSSSWLKEGGLNLIWSYASRRRPSYYEVEVGWIKQPGNLLRTKVFEYSFAIMEHKMCLYIFHLIACKWWYAGRALIFEEWKWFSHIWKSENGFEKSENVL